jgi:hypothetical protein
MPGKAIDQSLERSRARTFVGISRGVLIFCALCSPLQARATESDSFVQLHWRRGTHAESCPEQAELEQLVRARLGRDPFAANATRVIQARIDFAEGTWHVELHGRQASGPVQGRRVFDVHAESCAQVVDAVALAVALAIDPNASFSMNPTETTPAPAASDAGVPSDAAKPAAAGDAKVAPPTYPYAQILAPIEPACPAPSLWKTELTLRGMAAAGLLPGIAPGMAVAGSVGQKHSHVVLGFSYFPETSYNAEFSFGLTTLDLGYCHDVAQSRGLVASLCAEVHGGAQHPVIRQLVPVEPGEQYLAAVSLGPKLSWHEWAPFIIDAGVSAWWVFAHPGFTMKGANSPFFESQAISGVAYLGLGWMN